MRFGVCCSLDQANLVIESGFDYVELPAGSLFSGSTEPDYQRLSTLPVEATNLFVHGDLKLVGPDKGGIREYAERIIPRAAKAGVQVMVVGSGQARRSPAGYDLDAAEDDFYAAMNTCAQIGREYGVDIAPESLRPEETNVGCYMGDLARMLAYRQIGFTADAYHMVHQPGADPLEARFWENELPTAPVHVHLSDRDRGWRGLHSLDLAGFIDRLHDLGYDSRVSLECRWESMADELPQALEMLRDSVRRK